MTSTEMMRYKNWAVVGVKPEKTQYAYMIYQILKEKGYTAYPVNPRYDDIDGDKCYASVKDIAGEVDVVDMVVNPAVGIKLLDDIKEKGIGKIWLQPGSYDDDMIDKIKDMGFEFVRDCILARLKLSG